MFEISAYRPGIKFNKNSVPKEIVWSTLLLLGEVLTKLEFVSNLCRKF